MKRGGEPSWTGNGVDFASLVAKNVLGFDLDSVMYISTAINSEAGDPGDR